MSDIALKVEGLGKRYRIGADQSGIHRYKSLRDSIGRLARRPLAAVRSTVVREPMNEVNSFWALKDINFEVKKGEVVGIIGRNGAGKSTLLKILSRITKPTVGRVALYGRVGSLLEVGTGFHPELTGRENIYLNGAILGMTRSEVKAKFDEIVAFSEIEKFLDTAVKHYSSGMYTRLAFAVAAHLEPEILVVDEVLAVGDAEFQKKCLGKMKDVAVGGRTVLFVSHNMAAVQQLCQRALWLDHGIARDCGDVQQLIARYLGVVSTSGHFRIWNDLATAPGSGRARLSAVRILDERGNGTGHFAMNDPIIVEVEYRTLQPESVLNLSISVFTESGSYVFASPSITDTAWFQHPHPSGTYRSRCTIPGSLLNEGRYQLSILLVESGRNVLAQVDNAVCIEIVDSGAERAGYFGFWGGVVRPTLQWKTEALAPIRN